ncbi:MAG: hypothetical protein Q4B28_06925 [bacterium]|nr:hypothetical protein [bacterium]
MVAPLNGANIKILPSYLKDNQALIRIALEAYDREIVDKTYVQNLLYNEIG